MNHIISIAGHREGVGKTTTAVNLAAALAVLEKKTLLIDCDPQGAATTYMGVDPQTVSPHLYHAVLGAVPVNDIISARGMDFLHLIPSAIDLSQIEHRLSVKPGKEMVLRHLCREISDQFDYIIVDAPSSLGFLTISALAASNWVVVPTQCQPWALKDLGQLLEVVQVVRDQLNPDLRVAGALFTMCDGFQEVAGHFSRDALAEIKRIAFSTTIPKDGIIQESWESGKPVLFCDLTSGASAAYLDLGLELARLVSKTGKHRNRRV